MTGEPQEPDNQLITLENDPIYYEGITPEELLEGIDNSEQPRPRTAFFNNFPLRLIDPAYLEPPREQDFQKDLQPIKEEAVKIYLLEGVSAEKSLQKLTLSKEDYLLLSYMYIKMREKGYPRYDTEKPSLVR